MVIIKVPKAGAVVINASILKTTKKSFSLAVALYLIILIAVFLILAGCCFYCTSCLFCVTFLLGRT